MRIDQASKDRNSVGNKWLLYTKKNVLEEIVRYKT
jgi:hypothetical protein